MRKFFNFLSNILFLIKKRGLPGSLVIAYTLTSGKREFLIIKSRHSRAISFPSGGLDLFENFFEAAKREFTEETGLLIKKLTPTPLIHEFRYKNLPLNIRSFQKVFLGYLPKKLSPSPQDKDVEWAHWYEARKVLNLLKHQELKHTFKKALKYTG